MKISFCAGVAIFQASLALGALALGYPAVALAFGAFALVQTITVVAQRCVSNGACETLLVSSDSSRARPALDRR